MCLFPNGHKKEPFSRSLCCSPFCVHARHKSISRWKASTENIGKRLQMSFTKQDADSWKRESSMRPWCASPSSATVIRPR